MSGEYDYYHYLCDGTDDRGWGCGYRCCLDEEKIYLNCHVSPQFRTLQTLISWIVLKHGKGSVPSIKDIQECLVKVGDRNQIQFQCFSPLKVGDKEANFMGSKNWLGSVEVSITIDSLCDVPCRYSCGDCFLSCKFFYISPI